MKDNPEQREAQDIEDATDNELEDAPTVSCFNRDDDSIDWLEPLTASAPRLSLKFYSATKCQPINLSRKKFEERLSWCLNKLGLVPLPTALVDELFKMAVYDCQQMSAYRIFEKTLNGTEFTSTLDFVERERQRIELISTALNMSWNPVVPRKMNEWSSVWLGTLRELVNTIQAQLHSVETDLSRQRKWLTSGRTQLVSHLFHLHISSIRSMLKREKLRHGSIALLVAYGHASKLLRYEDDGIDGVESEPVEAMKMRMARAKKSNRRIDVLSLFLNQGLSG